MEQALAALVRKEYQENGSVGSGELDPLSLQEYQNLLNNHKIIPSNVNSSSRKEFLTHLSTLMEQELVKWRNFPADLPTSSFIDKTKRFQKGKLLPLNTSFFHVPDNVIGELVDLAHEPNGDRKKLSPEQLSQVRENGSFFVSSQLFEGKQYEWVLTSLLASGNSKHRLRFRYGIAFAWHHFKMMSGYLFSNQTISLAKAITSVPGVFRDLVSLFVGLPERKLSDVMENLLDAKRFEFIFKEFEPDLCRFLDDITRVNVENELLDSTQGILSSNIVDFEIDVRQWNSELWANACLIVQQIYDRAVDKWQQDKFKFLKEQLSRLEEEHSTDDLESLIIAACREEFESRVFSSISQSRSLAELGTDIPSLILAKLHVDNILIEAENEQRAARTSLVNSILREVIELHPTRRLVEFWVSDEVGKQTMKKLNVTSMEEVTYYYTREMYKAAISKLDSLVVSVRSGDDCIEFSKKLKQELYLLKRDYMWYSEHRLKDKDWIEQNMLIPTRTYTHIAPIILRSNQPIIHVQRGEYSYYYRKEYDKINVSSDQWFWRFRNLVIGSYCRWKSTTEYCFDSILYGPSSYKALFYAQPFVSHYNIDEKTGNELASRTNGTVRSWIRDLFVSVRRSRDTFERQPDTGFMGKGTTRVLNIVWNYIFKLGGGLSWIGLITIPRLFISLGLHSLYLPVNIIVSPMIGVLKYLSNILLYDTEKTSGYGSFPLVSNIVGGFLIKSLGRAALALSAATVLHPIAGCLSLVSQCTIASLGYTYDWWMYHLIVKRRGRVPQSNSFSATCISGPGVHSSCFYRIQPDEVLGVLELILERKQLDLFTMKKRMEYQLPDVLIQDFVSELFSVFNAYPSSHSEKQWNDFTKAVEQRKNELPVLDSLPYTIRNRVRLTPDDLNIVTVRAVKLIKKFVESKIYQEIFKDNISLIHLFWTEYDLVIGDWDGLVVSILEGWFGTEILVPLQDQDSSVKLQVTHGAHIENYIRNLASHQPTDDLENVKRTFSTTPMTLCKKLAPQIQCHRIVFGSTYFQSTFAKYPVYLHPFSLFKPHQ